VRFVRRLSSGGDRCVWPLPARMVNVRVLVIADARRVKAASAARLQHNGLLAGFLSCSTAVNSVRIERCERPFRNDERRASSAVRSSTRVRGGVGDVEWWTSPAPMTKRDCLAKNSNAHILHLRDLCGRVEFPSFRLAPSSKMQVRCACSKVVLPFT
jgi:hypothetical protein